MAVTASLESSVSTLAETCKDSSLAAAWALKWDVVEFKSFMNHDKL
jgi:hypothetical protein